MRVELRSSVIDDVTVEVRVDTCASCGGEFEQPRRQGRPRQKCDTCSGRAAPIVVRDEHRVTSDPPVRADGKCACGCGKKLQSSKQAHKYAGAQLDAEPFASTECCKRFYGVVFQPADEDDGALAERRRQGGIAAADQFHARHPRSIPGQFAR